MLHPLQRDSIHGPWSLSRAHSCSQASSTQPSIQHPASSTQHPATASQLSHHPAQRRNKLKPKDGASAPKAFPPSTILTSGLLNSTNLTTITHHHWATTTTNHQPPCRFPSTALPSASYAWREKTKQMRKETRLRNIHFTITSKGHIRGPLSFFHGCLSLSDSVAVAVTQRLVQHENASSNQT